MIQYLTAAKEFLLKKYADKTITPKRFLGIKEMDGDCL